MPPSLITIPPPPQQQARGVLGQVGGLGSMGGGAFVSQQPVQATHPAVQATPPLLPPVGGTQQPPLNPLDVLDNMTLALDTIKPGEWWSSTEYKTLALDTLKPGLHGIMILYSIFQARCIAPPALENENCTDDVLHLCFEN